MQGSRALTGSQREGGRTTTDPAHGGRRRGRGGIDPVTGLPNWAALHVRLSRLLRSSPPARRPLAVLVVDLDRFTEVNASFGHAAGDDLLREVAARLRLRARGRLVASLGEDKFAVVVPGADRAEASRTADELRVALLPHFTVAGGHIEVEASTGIAFAGEHDTDADTLLRHADVAMYAAKRAGAGWAFYASDEDLRDGSAVALIAELRHALARDELVLHYQPEADLRTGTIVGMEALVRWRHPRRGLLLPGAFVPRIERTGIMSALSRWVLGRALRECLACRRPGAAMRVAVNLSARDLLDPSLPGTVRSLLGAAAADPAWLALEITESALVAQPDRARESLLRVRALGVRIAVDDFGTGYSSLAYLSYLPVDALKIDGSLVRHLATDERSRAVARAIVQLGHSLGLEVVAEGVEDPATWRELVACGCDTAQGYHLSPALPAEELERWLSSREQRDH